WPAGAGRYGPLPAALARGAGGPADLGAPPSRRGGGAQPPLRPKRRCTTGKPVMGTDIGHEEFDDSDHARFAGRLEECLSILGQLLERPGFGAGPATAGAELEVFLIDDAARPLPHNQAIRAAVADPRITVELDRFNLELNTSPVPLPSRPFAAPGSELNVLLDRVADAASSRAGRLALIGILPTPTRADLGPGVITDLPRYRVLNTSLRRLRQDPFQIRIAGEDPLAAVSPKPSPAAAPAGWALMVGCTVTGGRHRPGWLRTR